MLTRSSGNLNAGITTPRPNPTLNSLSSTRNYLQKKETKSTDKLNVTKWDSTFSPKPNPKSKDFRKNSKSRWSMSPKNELIPMSSLIKSVVNRRLQKTNRKSPTKKRRRPTKPQKKQKNSNRKQMSLLARPCPHSSRPKKLSTVLRNHTSLK